jgi:hypothetical protein
MIKALANFKVNLRIEVVNRKFGCILNCRGKKCKFNELTTIYMTKEQLIISTSAHMMSCKH